MAVPSFSPRSWIDYIPLLALLARRLSDDEVHSVMDALIADGQLPADKAGIAVTITKVTNEMPREEDIDRVRSNLTTGGWPLADPFTLGTSD
ncbi:DUF3349 domain-containing protein [Rhodococcus sp. 1168]|uniref:DUF3349 domain-containing protein n=1 Tax=Rhodococcus sp. 1168 TaxID=2018041 RepID=UPI000A0B9922|nr:DUF3349 domain-containing protein [Rhodococcus sp. 1168]ORI23977.1 hypothetical protein BJI47_16085 [Rhodococcus sp. 1168]